VADERAELTHISNEILVAIRDRRRDALESALHPDFVQINEDGARLTRPAFVNAVVNADFQITALSFDFLSVDVLDDTGVVCGVQRGTVRLDDGKEVTSRSAFTDVFVRQNGAWALRVATSADLT